MQYVDENGDSHIYGVDCCIVGPVIFYNKDLFDEAGVEYIPTKKEDQWTWDEFVEN
ncbi:MAG: extracellular solute-binding protein, partial [Clostridium sp.]|nr:extracellular solute-binding protein [Clostridium sp.]